MPNCRIIYGEGAVFLHIYDLDSMTARINQWAMTLANAGIFHVGVELFGDEWYYRQACDDSTGIVRTQPMCHGSHAYRSSYYMGESPLSPEQFWRLLLEMKKTWKGSSYDLLRRNCQHFALEVCRLLGVAPVPEFVTRLPLMLNPEYLGRRPSGGPESAVSGDEVDDDSCDQHPQVPEFGSAVEKESWLNLHFGSTRFHPAEVDERKIPDGEISDSEVSYTAADIEHSDEAEMNRRQAISLLAASRYDDCPYVQPLGGDLPDNYSNTATSGPANFQNPLHSTQHHNSMLLVGFHEARKAIPHQVGDDNSTTADGLPWQERGDHSGKSELLEQRAADLRRKRHRDSAKPKSFNAKSMVGPAGK
eukprot:g2216.t1